LTLSARVSQKSPGKTTLVSLLQGYSEDYYQWSAARETLAIPRPDANRNIYGHWQNSYRGLFGKNTS